MFRVSTVKFDLHDELEELQARIYLDTKKKLSKKELLELVFHIGAQHYDLILKTLQSEETPLDDQIIQTVLAYSEDFGEGTEKLSSKVDQIVYGMEG